VGRLAALGARPFGRVWILLNLDAAVFRVYRNGVRQISLPSTKRLCAGIVILLAVATLPLASLATEKSRKPATHDELIALLEQGVPVEEVEALVQQYGVSFALTKQVESQLRDLGATEELIKAVRNAAPRPTAPPAAPPARAPAQTPTLQPAPPSASPPVLMIEFAPGGAQAYIDDEPVGTTSPEGRLKLSHLDPGPHRVRLALAGYRDFEQAVQLAAGETAKVTGSLEHPAATTALAAPPPVSEPPRSEPAPGYLGVGTVPQKPANGRGVMISRVEPNGPADKAGLRPYNVILSVGGREVNSPQSFRAAIASHSAGETVDISFYDGTRAVTRGVQLGNRPSTLPQAQVGGDAGSPPTLYPGSGGVASQVPGANPNLTYFYVAHDHGPPAPNFCVGVMAIGNGSIQYRSTNGVHSFDVALGEVREARKNAVYLSAFGAFHIRLKRGAVYNFAVINNAGQYQPADLLLAAIDRARGR